MLFLVYIAEIAEISPNFVVWKFCGKTHFLQFLEKLGEIKWN